VRVALSSCSNTNHCWEWVTTTTWAHDREC
jgi:hypothetical protein